MVFTTNSENSNSGLGTAGNGRDPEKMPILSLDPVCLLNSGLENSNSGLGMVGNGSDPENAPSVSAYKHCMSIK